MSTSDLTGDTTDLLRHRVSGHGVLQLSKLTSKDTDRALQIAVAAMGASLGLDEDRSVLYFDLIYASLSEAARKSLLTMDPAKYEFQSDFAKRFLSQGRVEGRVEGEASGVAKGVAQTLLKQLSLKFAKLAPLDAAVVDRVEHASAEELEIWIERVLDASSVDEVLR